MRQSSQLYFDPVDFHGGILAAIGLLAFLAVPSHALVIEGYTPSANNRFSYGFSTIPVTNTNVSYLGLGYDLSGVSWVHGTGLIGGNRTSNNTMITPLSFSLALHASSGFDAGSQLDFVNGSGQFLTSTIASMNRSVTVSGYSTDICIGHLTQAFTADQQVAVYRLLDVATRNYHNMPALIYGSQPDGSGPRIGTAWIGSSAGTTWYANGGIAGEAHYWEGGDSSSPAFIVYTAPDGVTQLTFVGTAWYPNQVSSSLPSSYYENYYDSPAAINNAIKGTGYALKWTIYDNPSDSADTATGWTGGDGNGNFAIASNWSKSAVPSKVPILLNADTANGQTTLGVNDATSLRGMLFKASISTNGFTFFGSNALTVDYSGIRNESTATQTFDIPIALANSQNWEAANGNLVFNHTIDTTTNSHLVVIGGAKDTIINGAIIGSGALAKDDAGTLTLAGANTYSGSTFIHNGTIRMVAGGSLPTSTPVTFIASNLAATLDLNGVNQTIGEVSSQYGGIGHVLLGGATLTINTIATGSNRYTGTIEQSGSVVKSGTGTWTLAGTNTYSGSTRIDDGALRLASTEALSSASNLAFNGGVVELGTANFTQSLGAVAGQVQFVSSGGFSAYGSDRVVNLGGSGASLIWGSTAHFLGSGNTLILSNVNSNAMVDFRNPIDFGGGTRTVQVNDGSAAIDARLSGTLSNGSLTKSGSGALELSQNNTYAGTTTVVGGSLLVTSANALSNGNLNLSGGVLVLGSGNFSRSLGAGVGQVQLGSAGGFAAYGADRMVNLGGAEAMVSWGQNSFNGLVLGSSAANATVDFQNPIHLHLGSDTALRNIAVRNGSAAIDGKISGSITGTGGFYVSGGGTLMLSGANSYTGVTQLINTALIMATPQAMTDGNIQFYGGLLILGAEDFTRSLGTGLQQVQFVSSGSGGFGAYGADRTVNLGGSGATLTWGQNYFVGQRLKLANDACNAMVDMQNPLNFNGQSFAAIEVGDGSASIDARLSGTLSNGGFAKHGTGTLELTGTNTYTGNTIINGGVLLISSVNALGSGYLYLNSGILGLNTNQIFTRSLGTGSGQVALWGGGGWAAFGADRTVNLGGNSQAITWGSSFCGFSPLILSASNADATLIFKNPIDLGSTGGNGGSDLRVIQVNDGHATVDARMDGAILTTVASSLRGLIKTGAGTLELASMSNSYGGPTQIRAGTLLVSGAIGGGTSVNIQPTAIFDYAGPSALSVAVAVDGGTFAYNSSAAYAGVLNFHHGTIGGTGNLGHTAIVLESGKTIAPGNNVGTLKTASQTWTGGGTYEWQINSLQSLSENQLGWDCLEIDGWLDMNHSDSTMATAILVQALSALPGWDSHKIYTWTIARTTHGLIGFDSSRFLIDDTQFASLHSLDGGCFGLRVTGNDLSLEFSPLPEPSSLLMLMLGMNLIGCRRQSTTIMVAEKSSGDRIGVEESK